LQAGEDWREMIDRAIRESMAVIAILSPESVASAYVTYEWAFALGAGVPVVPVLLRATPLHPRLEELQFLDFTNRRARPWTALVERLEASRGSGSGKKRPRKPTRREAAWDALREQLTDKHADIRAEAARALATGARRQRFPCWRACCDRSAACGCGRPAAEALGWIGTRRRSRPDRGAGRAHPRVGAAAREALRRIGTDEARRGGGERLIARGSLSQKSNRPAECWPVAWVRRGAG